MEKVAFKTWPKSSNEKLIGDSSLVFDLAPIIEKMKHKQNWALGEMNATILLKSRSKQVVLTAIHQGTEINSFQANDSITFQIIEGKVRFHSRDESVTLHKGQSHTLFDNIKYSLTGKEDAVLMLTIATMAFLPIEN